MKCLAYIGFGFWFLSGVCVYTAEKGTFIKSLHKKEVETKQKKSIALEHQEEESDYQIVLHALDSDGFYQRTTTTMSRKEYFDKAATLVDDRGAFLEDGDFLNHSDYVVRKKLHAYRVDINYADLITVSYSNYLTAYKALHSRFFGKDYDYSLYPNEWAEVSEPFYSRDDTEDIEARFRAQAIRAEIAENIKMCGIKNIWNGNLLLDSDERRAYVRRVQQAALKSGQAIAISYDDEERDSEQCQLTIHTLSDGGRYAGSVNILSRKEYLQRGRSSMAPLRNDYGSVRTVFLKDGSVVDGFDLLDNNTLEVYEITTCEADMPEDDDERRAYVERIEQARQRYLKAKNS